MDARRALYDLNAHKSPDGATVGAMGLALHFRPVDGFKELTGYLKSMSRGEHAAVWSEGRYDDHLELFMANAMGDSQWLHFSLREQEKSLWQIQIYKESWGSVRKVSSTQVEALDELTDVLSDTVKKSGPSVGIKLRRKRKSKAK